MAGFLLKVLVVALAVLLAGALFPSHIRVAGLEAALVFAVVLGILNALVRPVLLLLTLPLNLITLGLFTLVVNAIVFWLATGLQSGVKVNGFTGAVLGALTVSVVSFLADRLTSG